MDSRKFKGIAKRTLIVLLIALVVIQFIHPAKNNAETLTASDITKAYPVPDEVQKIMQKACNDCHSNHTTYPWYSRIQPVDWWLNDHIQEGKGELNFSEFGSLALLRQSKKLKKAAKEVEEGEMPLSSYTLIHRDAILTEAEKQLFLSWARDLSQQIYAKVSPEEIEADKKRMEERKKQAEKK